MIAHDMPRLLGGRYEVGRELGCGGTAVVLHAVDRLLGRPVAVKVPYPHLSGDPAFTQRFRQEARSAARLNHPNVVAIFDVGSQRETGAGGIDYIVMEFVEGCTLRQALQAGPLPHDEAASVALQVCAALQAAHASGVVHRDVKPANIMLGPGGHVKVTDFGVARALDATRLTQTGLVIATAQYASPEQLQGEDVDARSDVYSLGCCLYEMLAGSPPFTGADPVSVAFQQVYQAPTPLRRRDPLVPVGLAAVAARALDKQPGRRYQTAAEMAAELARARAGQRPAAPSTVWAADTAPIEVPDRGGPAPGTADQGQPAGSQPAAEPAGSSGRARWLWVAAGVASFLLGAGLGVWWLGATPTHPPAATPTSRSPLPTSTKPSATTAGLVVRWNDMRYVADGKSADLDKPAGKGGKNVDVRWAADTGLVGRAGGGLKLLCEFDPGDVPGRVDDPPAMVEALSREAGFPLRAETKPPTKPVAVPPNDPSREPRCAFHPTRATGVEAPDWAISALVKTSDGNWSILVAHRERGNQLWLRFATYAVS